MVGSRRDSRCLSTLQRWVGSPIIKDIVFRQNKSLIIYLDYNNDVKCMKELGCALV